MAPAKRRVGVALLLEPPVADEVEGLRRAVAGASPGRMAPHVTLVPPTNLRDEHLGAALARLRAAAGAVAGPLQLALGPTATFWPANAVVYLEVGGDLAPLRHLHAAVTGPPFDRPGGRPWVPHVTIAHALDESRLRAALAALDRYAVATAVHHLSLLEEAPPPGGRGRRWVPVADAALEPPAVVGRGGLALELTRSRWLDPEAAGLVASSPGAAGPAAGGLLPAGGAGPAGPVAPVVLTARREQAVVGVAAAWWADDGAHVGVLVAGDARRQGIGAHLLAHLESALRAEGWAVPVLQAVGPAGFYQARSRWARAASPAGAPGAGPAG